MPISNTFKETLAELVVFCSSTFWAAGANVPPLISNSVSIALFNSANWGGVRPLIISKHSLIFSCWLVSIYN
ncbi:MAG: hypothetical protein MRECE_55c010 [Mycoplasmataceae bacterium CE_OT135]|nr:MAG: hypothetical protein MRECE_55c010 [Mycoplasmataceae bacterium CE_OT135]